MNLLKSLSFFHYNIGFLPIENFPFLDTQQVSWLKHPYKDRFFADPFILKYTESEIFVLVEEFLYAEWKGNISLLVVDRDTYKLKRKKTLLDLETHLSFPFILRENNCIYVIPENSASGALKAYIYQEIEEELLYLSTIVDVGVIDPVFIEQNNSWYLLGGIKDDKPNEKLYMWESDQVLSGYTFCSENPIKVDKSCARRAGAILKFKDVSYAPTQCCSKSYGESTKVCKIINISKTNFTEEAVVSLYPNQKYPLGLHTLNIYKDLCVIDGLSYLFSPIRKILAVLKRKK